MKKFQFQGGNTTLIRYFVTYFLMFNILFLGFFITVRVQLKEVYFDDLHHQAEKRLAIVQEQFESYITSLNQVQSHLISNINLVLSRSNEKSYYFYEASKTINEYTIGNNIIDSICYIDHVNHFIYSSGKHIKEENGNYSIYNGSYYIDFNLANYKSSVKNRLIYLKDGNSQLLIYLPYNNGITSYSIFYIISSKELLNLLENGMITSIIAISLMDGQGQIVAGINTNLLPINMEEQSEMLYTIDNMIDDYSIAALLSSDAIMNQVNIAFRNTWLMLMFLACAGLVLIIWAMRVTYWPLHKLTWKVLPTISANESYVKQLGDAFSSVHYENKQLQKKIEFYRHSMQNSILDSIVKEHSPSNINIDHFFSTDADDHIFVLIIKVKKKHANLIDILKELKLALEAALPGENTSAALETGKDTIVFILQYNGKEKYKEEVMHLLVSDLCLERNCLAAISNYSNSPLDIPSLYENALAASAYWNQFPVVSYFQIAPLSPDNKSFSYPYTKLELLAEHLLNQYFADARLLQHEIIQLVDNALNTHTLFPDFFIRCVLIDILSTLVNYMNQQNMKFKTYQEIYFEALYLCRSCSYKEKREEIVDKLENLISICEAEYQNSTIHTAQIKDIIMRQYTSPDFSITILADTFDVSIAYMSYLFKRKFNENFSDYLWMLRMNKAKELLLNTEMTIDQISIAVGYLNTSSFRRRFKQETGVTPSRLREKA